MNAIYFYEGAIGRYAVEETEGYLTHIWTHRQLDGVSREMEVVETSLLREAKRQLDAYFSGQLREFTLPLAPMGTEFQMKVWKTLCSIPYGEVITYGQLAERVGNTRASRAVGMANSKNPLPVLIPCHRVIGAGGKLVGYTGGLDIKVKLLQIEGMEHL